MVHQVCTWGMCEEGGIQHANCLRDCVLCALGCAGGLARIKNVIYRAKQEDIPVVVLNSGDDLVGTRWDQMSANGSSVLASLMRQLPIDAMVGLNN